MTNDEKYKGASLRLAAYQLYENMHGCHSMSLQGFAAWLDQTIDEEKLLPCPFCGGEAKIVEYADDKAVECFKCKAATPMFDTREAAVVAWNKRKGK